MKLDPMRVIALDKLQLNEGQLTWLKKNPRQWTQTDIDRTKRSIDEDAEFMQARPLLAVPGKDKDTFVVFGGNLRLTAVRLLGWPGVPVVVFHPDNSQLDREAIHRIAIKDNGSFGSWDVDELANWDFETFELEDFGVPEYITGGAAHTEDASAPSASEDDFDEETDEIHVRCKPGDVWQLGDHRLMCGDSIDLQQVKTLMGGSRADMVFTDPPYGVAIGSKNASLEAAGAAHGRITEDIANDTLPVDELYGVLRQAMENVRESCKDDASYYVCAPPGGDMGLMMMMMMMRDAGLPVRHQIVWNKNSATFSLGRLDYDYKHEAIMYTWTKRHHNYRRGEFRTSVWDIDKPRQNDLHPTMKPLALIASALNDGTKEGDSVLDAFGGSGSTLIACEQLGRKCYMMEIDPHYCDVILARWEKLTGRTATKLN